MLDEQSYHYAIYCYTGAAAIMLLYLCWWLMRSWSWPWAVASVLVAAALLLTPAYPEAGASTLAPAVIVAAFQFLTEGQAAALETLRPVILLCAAAIGLIMVLRLTVFRRRSASGKRKLEATGPRAGVATESTTAARPTMAAAASAPRGAPE